MTHAMVSHAVIVFFVKPRTETLGGRVIAGIINARVNAFRQTCFRTTTVPYPSAIQMFFGVQVHSDRDARKIAGRRAFRSCKHDIGMICSLVNRGFEHERRIEHPERSR